MPELPRVTLYGKPGCHLCDEAEDRVRAVSEQIGIAYQKIDIRSSPALLARFRYSIPVIEIDGGATLDWPVTTRQIVAAVRAVGR
jgi:glutaredoxin